MSYFQSLHFSIFSFLEAFFRKTLHFRSSALWNVLFPKFSFFDFLLPRSFFFAKRCISGVLHSGMSYFQSFHFSIFSFPEAISLQTAAFPEFCTLECLISKVFIFRFLASQKLFFPETFNSRIPPSGM